MVGRSDGAERRSARSPFPGWSGAHPYTDPVVTSNTVTGGADQGVIVDEQAADRFEGNRVSGSGEVGVWVDNPDTRPRFSGNHVSACGKVGILVTNGAGGDFRSNNPRGNAGGSGGL